MTPRQELKALFENLCRLNGKKIGYEKGCWRLDYASCYGGYRIVEILEAGGEDHPFLSSRLSCKEMIWAIRGALSQAYLTKTKVI